MESRSHNQAIIQQSINQQAQAQVQGAGATSPGSAEDNEPGEHAKSGLRPISQPLQQSFSRLQHQMQTSPLPREQPQQQAPMGMAYQGLPPNLTPNQQ
jgi:hypothetical protein